MNPDLFDIPSSQRPMKIWKAVGDRPTEKGKRKSRSQRPDPYVFVQASTYEIATRVGKNWLRDVHRVRLGFIIPFTWDEYAREMARAGCNVTFEAKLLDPSLPAPAASICFRVES